ncbi:MAG: outer membrane beta-barrel protein [Gemmatimonas sp.]
MIKHVRALAVAAALAVPAMASAQDKLVGVGTKLLNVGVLVGSESAGSLGVGAGFEVGIKDIQSQVVLTVGGSVGFARSTFDYGVLGGDYSVTSIPVLGFVHGHYQLKNVPKLDLFAGPAIGVSMFRWDNDYCDKLGIGNLCEDSNTEVAVGIQAGARWALTPKVLGWAQLNGGNNMPFLNAGVSFKF